MKTKSIFGFDILLLVAALSLIVIGVLFVYSSNVTSEGIVFSNEYIKQIIWASTSLILLVSVTLINYEYFRRWALFVYVIFIILLIITLAFGEVVNGARSWLGVWQLGIQPSEFMKIALILFLARYFERRGELIRQVLYFGLGFVITSIPVLLILVQPDLGTAIVYPPIFLAMAFIAGGRTRHILYIVFSVILLIFFTLMPQFEMYIMETESVFTRMLTEWRIMIFTVLPLSLTAVLSWIGYFITKKSYFYWIMYFTSIIIISLLGSFIARNALKDYQMMRLIVFLKPQVDPRGAGWNIIQSVTAVGSGGVWGKGFLSGTQSHYQYLPQQSTDFIFSILAEEWGFIGSTIIVLLFMIILIRSLYIVSQSKDTFAGLIGAGIATMIFFHCAINIGMAIGLMPITGIPLFFLSYGGSSLWTVMIGIGILLNIYIRRYRY